MQDITGYTGQLRELEMTAKCRLNDGETTAKRRQSDGKTSAILAGNCKKERNDGETFRNDGEMTETTAKRRRNDGETTAK